MPPVQQQQRHHYRIPASAIEIGLFVADLDRPWIDTPFLLQGFIVESNEEVIKLRTLCSFVYVDLDRGDTLLSDKIIRRFGEPAKDPPPEVNKPIKSNAKGNLPVAPVKRRRARGEDLAEGARERFQEMIESFEVPAIPDGRSWLERLLRRLRKQQISPSRSSRRPTEPVVKTERPAFVPATIELYDYGPVVSLERELPAAQKHVVKLETVVDTVISDISSGRPPSLQDMEETVDGIVDSMIANPDAMMWVTHLRERDNRTYNHGLHVSMYLIALGRQIGFPKDELSHLGMIGLLADVGKLRIDRKLLEKPGMLTPSEYKIVQGHVQLGIVTLRSGGSFPREVELGIAEHHERIDGSGYPKGMRGDEISIYGRLAGICDTFAALTAPRPYADALSPQDALMSLLEWSGKLFHETLVEQLVQAIGAFPVGSLVELSTGEAAVVIAQNRVRRLEPRVVVLTDPYKMPLDAPEERDLLKRDKGEAPIKITRGLPTGSFGLNLEDYYLSELEDVGSVKRPPRSGRDARPSAMPPPTSARPPQVGAKLPSAAPRMPSSATLPKMPTRPAQRRTDISATSIDGTTRRSTTPGKPPPLDPRSAPRLPRAGPVAPGPAPVSSQPARSRPSSKPKSHVTEDR